eukprot:CAMPEP_0170960622 /NCGR_PEP_ID=MMETSP0735-20130129/37371_1 /TAXON_ID=186038 /ORGANISM="Fragilariopsis kerguelensis, Strain L26-C5" /LENGTH=45 /DNA_ID= /DNA_START= /DNA_END= /DNA_ORIENTATION=
MTTTATTTTNGNNNNLMEDIYMSIAPPSVLSSFYFIWIMILSVLV